MRLHSLAPAFAGLLFASTPTLGSENETEAATRIGRAAPTVEAPAIDGRLDEDVWASAEPLTNFVQAEPFEGQPATERTEVRILFDEDAIYVGAMLYDSDPEGIIATDARRDSGLEDTDSFRVVFDTYHDLQNGFVFGTTPAGLEYDGQLSNAGGGGGGGGGGPQMRARTGSGGGFNVNWDASWTVATAVTDEGWAAEFAIPLRTLRYGDEPADLGDQLPPQHPQEARGGLLVPGSPDLQPLPALLGGRTPRPPAPEPPQPQGYALRAGGGRPRLRQRSGSPGQRRLRRGRQGRHHPEPEPRPHREH